MAEYFAFPVFDETPGRPSGDLDPRELPLSEELVAALAAWNDEYEVVGSTDAGWPSPEAAWQWWNRGLHLAKRLQGELGPDHDVRYVEEEPMR